MTSRCGNNKNKLDYQKSMGVRTLEFEILKKKREKRETIIRLTFVRK